MLDKRNLYRMPWSMNDNPIAWLEITDICNIHCEGCYRQRLTGLESDGGADIHGISPYYRASCGKFSVWTV